jgi:HK97 family phage major capsid protein
LSDETAFLFGTGVNQPNGIIPGIPANMQVATAAAGSVTADDIIDEFNICLWKFSLFIDIINAGTAK